MQLHMTGLTVRAVPTPGVLSSAGPERVVSSDLEMLQWPLTTNRPLPLLPHPRPGRENARGRPAPKGTGRPLVTVRGENP